MKRGSFRLRFSIASLLAGMSAVAVAAGAWNYYQSNDGLPWRDYSVTAIQKAHQREQIVVVKFAPIWSRSGRGDGGLFYDHRHAVQGLVDRTDAVLMEADTTTSYSRGTEELRRLGATAPAVVVYGDPERGVRVMQKGSYDELESTLHVERYFYGAAKVRREIAAAAAKEGR